jgi:HK97 gp10 family phage protein
MGHTRITWDDGALKDIVRGEQSDRVLQEIGDRIVSRAQGLVRVDTGALRDSITAEVSDGVLTVGTDSPYALANELGTQRMTAQPFLRPALDAGSG